MYSVSSLSLSGISFYPLKLIMTFQYIKKPLPSDGFPHLNACRP